MIDRYWSRIRVRLRELLGHAPARSVFLHIPRCAGSSLGFHFKVNFGSQRSGRVVLFDTWNGCAPDEPLLRRARSALFVSGHFGWRTLESLAGGALRLTALREPIARLRSLYTFSKQVDREKAARHAGFLALADSAKRSSFEEFCLNRDPDARAMLDNAQARALAHDYHPMIEEAPARTLEAAKRNLDSLDMIWDADQFDSALPIIAARTGTKVVAGRTALNRTRRSERLSMTRASFLKDPRLAALVAMDMEVFEYAKKRWAPHVHSAGQARLRDRLKSELS